MIASLLLRVEAASPICIADMDVDVTMVIFFPTLDGVMREVSSGRAKLYVVMYHSRERASQIVALARTSQSRAM